MLEFKERKTLGYEPLIKVTKEIFSSVTDKRQIGKIKYTMEEILTSAFGCFYFQEPSFLQFQLKMQEERGQNNMTSMLGIANIPKETQIRDVIDTVDSKEIEVVFKEYIHRLQRAKELEKFALQDNKYLLVLDGVQHFASNQINCRCCLQKNRKDGTVSYSHQAVQAIIMHPDKKQVFPIMAEEINNKDGNVKQDSEINASKRLLERLHKAYPKMHLIVCGDDLYSKDSLLKQIKGYGWNVLMTAKPTSHKKMSEYLAANAKEMEELVSIDSKNKKKYIHGYIEDVPLTGNKDMEIVNYLSLCILDDKGKTTYFCSWITDLHITKDNIQMLVRAARARWKIENECFNNLKNRGYHLEHNFGHGEKLTFNLYLLLLSAFFIHQILELTDELYIAVLTKCHQKKLAWGRIIFAVDMLFFESWKQMLLFVYDPDGFRLMRV